MGSVSVRVAFTAIYLFCHLCVFVLNTVTVELEQMQLQSVQVDKIIEVDIFQLIQT